MSKYTVEAVRRIHLRATIEADNYGEACRIADEEMITDDFEEIGGDFTLTYVA